MQNYFQEKNLRVILAADLSELYSTALKHFLSSELALAVSSTFWHTAACMFQLTALGPIGGLTLLPTYCDKLWFAFRVTDRRFVNIQSCFFKGPPFPNIFISTFCILLYISQMEMWSKSNRVAKHSIWHIRLVFIHFVLIFQVAFDTVCVSIWQWLDF